MQVEHPVWYRDGPASNVLPSPFEEDASVRWGVILSFCVVAFAHEQCRSPHSGIYTALNLLPLWFSACHVIDKKNEQPVLLGFINDRKNNKVLKKRGTKNWKRKEKNEKTKKLREMQNKGNEEQGTRGDRPFFLWETETLRKHPSSNC